MPLRQAAPVAALAVGAAFVLAAPVQAAGYATEGRCAGWPRVAVASAPGHCVALLAGPAQGLRMPRRLLEVAPGRFWLTDMGSWDAHRGRLLELSVQHGATPAASLRVLAEGLDRPHGLALGPDGKVYVGEAGRIWRSAPGPALQREAVIDGLPADGAHPLKELAFAPGGRLFINVGSASDACRNDAQQQPMPCPEVQGERPRAAVWEAVLGGPQRTLQSLKPYAAGLRNSLALAWEPGAGVLWQGENSVDYPQAERPAEELNRLRPGADHGWPYCVAAQEPARGYAGRGFDCRRSVAPHALWPAHSAPLQMLFAPRGLSVPWAGQMLVAWHGYRAGGHRVVGFALGRDGQPAARPVTWFGGSEAPGQPRPAPAGVALDAAGRLYVVDDRNRAVLLLARDAAAR
ncbi:glucose/sorbosone dehydrogenase [Burkholderiales bacterium JOSHI_001]|nr:glucose/sorbosone dehydrogenase [Burkholderiales bacterium JOSHI_001]